MLEKLALTIREQSAAGPLHKNVDAAFAEIRQLLGVAAAGYALSLIAFIFAPDVAAMIIGLVAAGVGSWGIIAALMKRREILRQFVTAVVTRREELLAPIEDYLRTDIEAAYEKLSASFHPKQARVAERRSVHELIVARVTELEATLAKCASDLGISPRK